LYFILVVYDISNNKRRTKLHNTLLNYGTAVQYSVFECLLDQVGIKEMKRDTMRIVNIKKDNVRFYSICKSCLEKIEVIGGREMLLEPPDAMIVG